ncbi:MAG: RNA-binding S4 domain-containing protein [Thermotogaceae bacterium]|nr:RNA-binding S4 domain-containing protein [Thermotogaceae bacterium]
MRLDKFLKRHSLIKRRVIAQQMIKGGRVKVNKRAIKPSCELKDGDEIEIFFGNRYLKIRVVAGGYEVLEDERVKTERF